MTWSTGYFLLCLLFASLFAWIEVTPLAELGLAKFRKTVSLSELAVSSQPISLADTDSSLAGDLRFDLNFRFQFQPEHGDTLLFGSDAFEEGFNLIIRPPAIPVLAIKNGNRSAMLIEFSELKPWETYDLHLSGDRSRFSVAWNGHSTDFTANLSELPGLHHVFVAGLTAAVPKPQSRALEFQLDADVREGNWLVDRIWSWADKIAFSLCLISGTLLWRSLEFRLVSRSPLADEP